MYHRKKSRGCREQPNQEINGANRAVPPSRCQEKKTEEGSSVCPAEGEKKLRPMKKQLAEVYTHLRVGGGAATDGVEDCRGAVMEEMSLHLHKRRKYRSSYPAEGK